MRLWYIELKKISIFYSKFNFFLTYNAGGIFLQFYELLL